MTERSLTTTIARALSDRGAWVFKVHGNGWQRAGVPDLLVGYRGRLVGMEIKTQDGRVSPLQTREIESLRAAGCLAAVVRSKAEALDLLDSIDRADAAKEP